MHDSFSKDEGQNIRQASRINDCFANSKDFVPPGMLFGEFWCEGEMALLFGATGTGKSILALQIADAAARGRGVEAFKMEAKRQKVLYVDLALSNAQLQMRYTHAAKHYEFSRNLYRERPASNDKLCAWLRERINDNGYKVIIIDDINAVSQSCDGTRQILKLMRELKQLKDELGISVLVLAGAHEPGWKRFVSEADMRRSRVLCEVADSVFALGRNPRHRTSFYMIQTRSRSSAISWTVDNAPYYSIKQSEDGLLKLAFDDRFATKIDEEVRQLICDVKRRRDAGEKFRAIADKLGISKWKACELFKKWRPELDPTDDSDDDFEFDDDYLNEYEDEEEDDEGEEDGEDDDGNGNGEYPAPNDMPVGDANEESPEVPTKPGHHERRADLSGLKRTFDRDDREIFVEKEDENGKPMVWYMYGTSGNLSRWEFGVFGTGGRHVDGPICLFNTS